MADANVSPTLQASSAIRKSGMSVTLPRNFAPLSLDGNVNEPRTPDRTFAELDLPPPPPHSTYRIRRPRIKMDNFQTRNNALPTNLFASELQMPTSVAPSRRESSLPPNMSDFDEPIPSIETPFAARPMLQTSVSEPLFSESLLIPSARHQPPRTPPAQTTLTTPELKRSKWEMHRAASVCSNRSESSSSSNDTYATRPTSFDGSATSPDCDNQDPFSPELVKIIPDTPTRRSKKLRHHFTLSKDNVEWSIEMDNHLFNVYQMYLADPTVTPFKTVPGSIPPTGVCHRVSRRARDTWPKASRIDVPIIRRYKVRNLLDMRRFTRDKTPELDNFLMTDNTPGSGSGRAPWPSESSTRRRLKQLCREKFTISAHYQRLRESRSPSPFAEQFLPRASPRPARSVTPTVEETNPAGSYTTRELGISLVASDATAPLARIVAEDHHMMRPISEDLSNAPLSVPEPMNISTPSCPAPIPEPGKLAPVAAKIPRLASPFNYSTWNGPSSKTHHRRHISHNQYGTIHATGSRLLSPFRPEPDVAMNINKRRAQHNLEDELSPSGSNITQVVSEMEFDDETDFSAVPALKPGLNQELVFTGTGDISQRRIRVRNRGVSLGTHPSGLDRVNRLFTPPPPIEDNEVPPVPTLPAFLSDMPRPAETTNDALAVPELDPAQRRLGSPFELDPTKRSLRNRNPRHAPSMSDPFISSSQFGMTPLTSGIANLHSHNNSIGGIGERLAASSQMQRSGDFNLQ